MPSIPKLDSFTETTLQRQRLADEAMYARRPTALPRPVVPAGSRQPVRRVRALQTGWAEVSQAVGWVGTRFSDGDMTHDVEVASVGAELAYTVGYEHGEVAIDGVRQPVKLRVTLIYRREDGDWKLVHRHGDFAPVDQSPSS